MGKKALNKQKVIYPNGQKLFQEQVNIVRYQITANNVTMW